MNFIGWVDIGCLGRSGAPKNTKTYFKITSGRLRGIHILKYPHISTFPDILRGHTTFYGQRFGSTEIWA